MQFSQHIAVKTKYTFLWKEDIHGIDVKNIYINRNNITLTNQNGNMLDIHVAK